MSSTTQPSGHNGAPARRGDAAATGVAATSMDELLTAEQVATLLGMRTGWVYEQSRKGSIPTITLGRYRRYRRHAIERWLGELEAEPPRDTVLGRAHA